MILEQLYPHIVSMPREDITLFIRLYREDRYKFLESKIKPPKIVKVKKAKEPKPTTANDILRLLKGMDLDKVKDLLTSE